MGSAASKSKRSKAAIKVMLPKEDIQASQQTPNVPTKSSKHDGNSIAQNGVLKHEKRPKGQQLIEQSSASEHTPKPNLSENGDPQSTAQRDNDNPIVQNDRRTGSDRRRIDDGSEPKDATSSTDSSANLGVKSTVVTASSRDNSKKPHQLSSKSDIGASTSSDPKHSQSCEGENRDDTSINSWSYIPIPDDACATTVCVICLYSITNPRALKKCGHLFCAGCIKESFRQMGPKCPSCGQIYGTLKGNMPENSSMDVSTNSKSLPGHKRCGHICIRYSIPSGIQKDCHPNPGEPYHGTSRTAYLPDNAEGRKVLGLLRRAFDARLTFTIGISSTTGYDNRVIWNDIHHKISTIRAPL